MTDDVKIESRDGVMRILLDRANKKNALTSAMYEKISSGFDEADADPNIRAILIEGAGGDFSAGNDIKDFIATAARGEPLGAARFIVRLAQLETPLVAAVKGVAVGVGATMLFHCDFVYADPTAAFRMPFVDLALVPEAASSVLVPQRFGMAKANEFLLLGDSFDAAEAQRLGLVNAVCAPEALSATALKTAERLAAKPPEALRTTRRLLRGDPAPLVETMMREMEAFNKALLSQEAQTAFAAFMRKGEAAAR